MRGPGQTVAPTAMLNVGPVLPRIIAGVKAGWDEQTFGNAVLRRAMGRVITTKEICATSPSIVIEPSRHAFDVYAVVRGWRQRCLPPHPIVVGPHSVDAPREQPVRIARSRNELCDCTTRFMSTSIGETDSKKQRGSAERNALCGDTSASDYANSATAGHGSESGLSTGRWNTRCSPLVRRWVQKPSVDHAVDTVSRARSCAVTAEMR